MTRIALWKVRYRSWHRLRWLLFRWRWLHRPAPNKQCRRRRARFRRSTSPRHTPPSTPRYHRAATAGASGSRAAAGKQTSTYYRGLSVAAELTGSRVGNVTPGVDISQIAVMGGPRYTFGTSRWTDRIFGSRHRTSFFGEALFGGVHAFDGVYPSSTGLKTTASAFSMQVGGGFNVRLARNFALRAFEVDYVRSEPAERHHRFAA